jgi:hypothetical protein
VELDDSSSSSSVRALMAINQERTTEEKLSLVVGAEATNAMGY